MFSYYLCNIYFFKSFSTFNGNNHYVIHDKNKILVIKIKVKLSNLANEMSNLSLLSLRSFEKFQPGTDLYDRCIHRERFDHRPAAILSPAAPDYCVSVHVQLLVTVSMALTTSACVECPLLLLNFDKQGYRWK